MLKATVCLLTVAALVIAGRDAVQRWDSLAAAPSWSTVRWPLVGLAAALYGIGLIPPALVLHRTVIALGLGGNRDKVHGDSGDAARSISLGRSVAAQLLGHAGKYVPGKAVVVVLRVGALKGRDATPPGFVSRATIAVFYETLLMMSVGGTFAGVLLWSTPLPGWVKLAATAMAIFAAFPTLPPVMRIVLGLVGRTRANLDAALFSPRSIDWRLLGSGWGWSLLSWLCIGTSFAVLVTAIPVVDVATAASTPANLWLAASAAISLGMVLGFASLIPGGAGVREYVTLLVLTPVIGPTHALLSVIAARMLFIVVETIMALISFIALQRASR